MILSKLPLFKKQTNNIKGSAKVEMDDLTTDLMSSYSPSGGMKLMLRSESNLLRRTHWWKVQSSMAIDCFPLRKTNAEVN